MLYWMIEESFEAIVKRLAQDPAYRAVLTGRLAARTIDREILDRLIVYARGRQSSMSQAMARKALTDAGVSWEAL
jgi:hypothetical protein